MTISPDLKNLLTLTLDESIPFAIWHQEIRLALADIAAEEVGEEASVKIRELPDGKSSRLSFRGVLLGIDFVHQEDEVAATLFCNKSQVLHVLHRGVVFGNGQVATWSMPATDDTTEADYAIKVYHPGDTVRGREQGRRHLGVDILLVGVFSRKRGTIFVREWAESDIRREAYDLACGQLQS